MRRSSIYWVFASRNERAPRHAIDALVTDTRAILELRQVQLAYERACSFAPETLRYLLCFLW
jgi:hypothetical protein